MASQVFISYAADTKPFARELTEALQEHGIRAWTDFDFRAGERFQDELRRVLDEADTFVILVRPDSRATNWSESEWRAVLEKTWMDSGKTLLPVVIGAGDPPAFLRPWVSCKVDPLMEPGRWTGRVIDALLSEAPRYQGLTERDRRERSHRLDEIADVADELRRLDSDARLH